MIMKILFVVESCLRINTSANLCHLAYIRGAVEAGYDVDVISITDQDNAIDKSINLPDGVNWIYVDPPRYSNSFNTTIGSRKKVERNKINNLKECLLAMTKVIIKIIYGVYGRTPSLWVREASKYKSKIKYDYCISLATPFISHKLAANLINRGNIDCSQFIEIWEDPWTLDLFNKQDKRATIKEERRLLSYADKIIYVSPLTLKYQQELFPEYKAKMLWHPLPYYYLQDKNIKSPEETTFGYYGDYFSFSRNLRPFYEAAKLTEIRVNIFGNTDENFKSTNKIIVRPRVDLKTLNAAEDETSVYVFLCNLKGGQIPGKIYQNSASKKHILFILDGTDEEKKILRKFFEQFNRYEFCDNDIESISKSIKRIVNGESESICEPIVAFSPKKTMEYILKRNI